MFSGGGGAIGPEAYILNHKIHTQWIQLAVRTERKTRYTHTTNAISVAVQTQGTHPEPTKKQ